MYRCRHHMSCDTLDDPSSVDMYVCMVYIPPAQQFKLGLDQLVDESSENDMAICVTWSL